MWFQWLEAFYLIIGISIDCFLGGFQVVCFYRRCSSNFEKLFGLIFSQESWFTFVGSAVAFEKKLLVYFLVRIIIWFTFLGRAWAVASMIFFVLIFSQEMLVYFFRRCRESSNWDKFFGLLFSQESWFTFSDRAIFIEKKWFTF